MKTRTGSFPIGFRRGWTEWHKSLPGLVEWAKTHDLEAIDINDDADKVGRVVLDAGLGLGSIDLKAWRGLISASKATRKKAVSENKKYIEACAKLGAMNYFVVMLPENPDLSRADNFGYMVEGYTALAPILESANAKLVIEGWPGPGALCCTPEGYRAFFKAVPSKAMGVNFDPSHLLRMGIDPLRFLEEFGSRVFHVHGKDTELIAEGSYEYGHEQPPTFGKAHGFGGMTWRYTIPGHGHVRWVEVMRKLSALKYKGRVCIELEDENFNGSTDGEQRGILAGASFLASV
jgi:sugar phosphate isomerase/epimerase